MLPAAPLTPRSSHAAVWTGSEMLIWGGLDQLSESSFHPTADGAAYDPATNRWRSLPRAPLSPRWFVVATWTGSRLIVLGGRPAMSTETMRGYPDGASYDPAADTWQTIKMPSAPGGHPLAWRLAVYTGRELLAWSLWSVTRGVGSNAQMSGGTDMFAYDEETGRWRLIPPAPGALLGIQEALWTGRTVIVRGFLINCVGCLGPSGPESTALYDSASNVWTRLPDDPIADTHPISLWTGGALWSFDAFSQSGAFVPGDASAFDPKANTWTQMPRAPFGCGTSASPVWTGRQILVYCTGFPAAPAENSSGLVYTPGA